MMSESSDVNLETDDDGGPDLIGLTVTAVSLVLCVAFWYLQWMLAFYGMSVVLISVVIWQACDPFADAAQWIGEKFHIPGSVRGATLDAVASSLPELFTGIFFVVVAFYAVAGSESAEEITRASGEGFGSTIATCAGSAVYNMILIPAIVALVISFWRPKRPTVDVEDKVIARDGMVFLACEVILLIFLFMNELYWWMGAVLFGMYLVYLVLLYTDWKRFQAVKNVLVEKGVSSEPQVIVDSLRENGKHFPVSFVQQVQDEIQRGDDDDEEEEDDSAGVAFGFFDVELNQLSAWLIIGISTLIAAGACYFLVEVTRDLSAVLNVPIFFVAVIVAAAASSVPDTFLSVGAAMRGDDSGAVSNAFGSNIFDICICLSIPLVVGCYLNSWEPISLMQDGKPMAGLVGLRILLGVLTAVTLAIMWHNRQLTRNKAFILCGLYCVFIAYAVLGSLGVLDI